ncbi:MAG: hypothetical protein ABJB74_05250 [Gemmatimonas sp.]
MSLVPLFLRIKRALSIRSAMAVVALAVLPASSISAQLPHTAPPNVVQRAAGHIPNDITPVQLMSRPGTWSRRVNTNVTVAQSFFDQGLRMYYAFNHAEAVRAFREAQRLDPKCVMCFWGEAIALGPNVNTPMNANAERQAIEVTERGLMLLAGKNADSKESVWMNAAAARYLGRDRSRAERDTAYAVAMKAIAAQSPRDADALTLAAEAAMDLSPRLYWTREGSARPGTDELLTWLERGMQMAPTHPGACHFYIYAVEAAHPERAERCADRLAHLVPGAGRSVPIPAHIYARVGRWADAIKMAKYAVYADDEYFEGAHTPNDALHSAMYQADNFRFLAMVAVMTGASATALDASAHVADLVTPEIARQFPSQEALMAVPVQTLVTFGRWEETLRRPLPPADLRIATSHFWYARGIAFAATGRVSEARATIDSITAVARTLPESETRTTLAIATRMIEGELALRAGNASQAVVVFADAAAMEDNLLYSATPAWYHPVRHSLGKALLAAGRPQDAEQVYLADLRRFPENGWSLRGLADALRAQNLKNEATAIEKRFKQAWRLADVKITASRLL